MECATEFSGCTASDHIQPVYLLDSYRLFPGQTIPVYGHDCSQNTGTCDTVVVVVWFLPGVLQIPSYYKSGGFSFFHINIVKYLTLTICTGPWRLQPSKVSVRLVCIWQLSVQRQGSFAGSCSKGDHNRVSFPCNTLQCYTPC